MLCGEQAVKMPLELCEFPHVRRQGPFEWSLLITWDQEKCVHVVLGPNALLKRPTFWLAFNLDLTRSA